MSTKISHTFKCLKEKILSKLKIPCELFIARLRKQYLNQIVEMWDLS